MNNQNEKEVVEYDEEADALYVGLRSAEVVKTITLDDHRLIDLGENGEFLGIEFIDVSAGIDVKIPGFAPEAGRIEELLRGRSFKVFA